MEYWEARRIRPCGAFISDMASLFSLPSMSLPFSPFKDGDFEEKSYNCSLHHSTVSDMTDFLNSADP